MSKITAGKLSKILEEHKRWCDTDGEEGEQADLSGANLNGADLSGANLYRTDLSGANLRGADLRRVIGLEFLSNVTTLYKAKLDPELMEQVKDKYPHLLKKSKSEE